MIPFGCPSPLCDLTRHGGDFVYLLFDDMDDTLDYDIFTHNAYFMTSDCEYVHYFTDVTI